MLLKNIQTIKEYGFHIPDTGVVQLRGNNSNGKSILIKVLAATVKMEILDEEKRCTLIRDGCDSGTCSIQYKKKVLIININRARNECYVVLIRENEEKIVRTFRDGGIPELIEEFGFCVYNKNSICLQIHETFGAIPFVNTTDQVNYEIIDSIMTDSTADAFVKHFKEITYKKAREELKEINAKLEELKRSRSRIIVYDYLAYSDSYKKMKSVFNIIKQLEVIELPLLQLPPHVVILDIQAPEMKPIPFITPVPVIASLDDASKLLLEMETILDGTCPSCGKKFIDGQESVRRPDA